MHCVYLYVSHERSKSIDFLISEKFIPTESESECKSVFFCELYYHLLRVVHRFINKSSVTFISVSVFDLPFHLSEHAVFIGFMILKHVYKRLMD